jgi:hypothetical protein
MTKRTPISAEQNIWFDAQQVDATDLSLEQTYNTTINAGIINNHIGNGVLSEALTPRILFDSLLQTGFLDGVAIFTQSQPSDNNLGNQLEISLTNSTAAGKRTVKVGIIGLDFQSNLQYETFVFQTNESQVTTKHYTKILLLLFNDLIGNPELSLNLGGHLVIKEVNPLTLSRSPVMVSQTVEPNLFFRDFFVDGYVDGYGSVINLIQTALPLYNVDSLNIYTTGKENKILYINDVTTQLGQKFLATTNNIQKVTLLMSVRNQEVGYENDLAWTGDLVVSIYPLQSNLNCPTDIAANLQIEFPPSNIPVAQLSVNYGSLQAAGTVLDSVPQPVDFVFSNSTVAGGNVIVPGNYYAITVKRSGAANKCDLLITSGNDTVPDSRVTVFTGTLWVDLPDEDLWFCVWTDAAKMSDGQAYDSGLGMILPKTILDTASQATIDYCLQNLQFTGNDVYRAVVQAITDKTTPVPDQRTGNPVLSRQEIVPGVKLLNTLEISNLENASEPLLIGAIADKNRKYYDAISAQIVSKLFSATLAEDEILIRIVDDPTDAVRFDNAVTGLVTNLLNGDLNGARIYPNYSNPNIYYRVADAKLCSMLVGDVNGDGLITEEDLVLLNTYLNYNLNIGLPQNTVINTDGYITTFTNGYTTYTNKFTNIFNISFQLVETTTGVVAASGTDGVLVADPNNPRLAQFTSASVNFNTIIGLSSYKLVVISPLNPENNGGFDIISISTPSDVLTIRKVYLTGDVLGQMLRADIDGDFAVTTNDGYLLQNYIDRYPLTTSGTTTYPAPATNAYTKIGTPFNVIRLKVEKFVDRADDYSPVTVGRSTTIHPLQDIFLNDGYYFASHDFYTNPAALVFEKQLTWTESLIVVNSRPKQVPSVFTTLSGFIKNECNIQGILCNVYGSKPDFNSGRVDVFAPDNIILGEGGELHRPDGNFYKVDFEVGTIVLEVPDGLFGTERTINIMDDFIADYTGAGVTRLGFPAMRFADCSYVKADALTNDQVRFSVAVQSFSPNTNGLSNDGYTGAIVDGKIGIAIDYSTGLLTLNFTNLFQDEVLRTLSTKIQVSVYLKKGGFNNRPLFVDSTKLQNMLKLISVFSGAVDGGPSALVDLATDITGVLPIVHGGTGLNSVGVFGTVLVSNGSGLSYQFITSLPNVIPFSLGIPDADKIPKTDGYGLLDPSFMYKNPVYIYGTAGIYSNDNATNTVIGAFPFRFDNYILQGLSTIKLEVILETTNVAQDAEIRLYDVANATYINLVGGNPEVSTTNTSPTYLASDDIKTLLNIGASDFLYEIHLRLNTGAPGLDTAICKMARLVMTYDNPYAASPPTAHSWNFVPYLPSPTPI